MRVLVRLRGGLGNQMFQYATGRAIALESDGHLELDLRALYGQRGHEFYGLDAFRIEAPMCPKWRLPNDGIDARSTLRMPKFLRRYHRLQDFGSRLDPSQLVQCRNTWLQGSFQSEVYFAKHSDQIRREFRFKDEHSKAVDYWLARIGEKRNSVSVHVRRGDYLPGFNENRSIATCGVGYFQAAVVRLAETAPDLAVFVFSDDTSWVRENLKFAHPTEFVSGNRPDEDMRLMAACRHNVIANSTFSWWGAWLNPHSDKQIVAPDRWRYKSGGASDWIVPESWIKLPVSDPYRAGPHRPS